MVQCRASTRLALHMDDLYSITGTLCGCLNTAIGDPGIPSDVIPKPKKKSLVTTFEVGN